MSDSDMQSQALGQSHSNVFRSIGNHEESDDDDDVGRQLLRGRHARLSQVNDEDDEDEAEAAAAKSPKKSNKKKKKSEIRMSIFAPNLGLQDNGNNNNNIQNVQSPSRRRRQRKAPSVDLDAQIAQRQNAMDMQCSIEPLDIEQENSNDNSNSVENNGNENSNDNSNDNDNSAKRPQKRSAKKNKKREKDEEIVKRIDEIQISGDPKGTNLTVISGCFLHVNLFL